MTVQQADTLIGFTAPDSYMAKVLASGVNGALPAGSNEQTMFRKFCAGNAQCFFPQVTAGSEAAYDLGLGGQEPDGTPETAYGQNYVSCNDVFYNVSTTPGACCRGKWISGTSSCRRR
jgi:hypothetical protein